MLASKKSRSSVEKSCQRFLLFQPYGNINNFSIFLQREKASTPVSKVMTPTSAGTPRNDDIATPVLC